MTPSLPPRSASTPSRSATTAAGNWITWRRRSTCSRRLSTGRRGRLEIIVDGGIRRGSDIVKALALGADACSIGRPYLYGLAAAGQAGVAHVLNLFAAEMTRTMMLLGVSSDQGAARRRPRPDPAPQRGPFPPHPTDKPAGPDRPTQKGGSADENPDRTSTTAGNHSPAASAVATAALTLLAAHRLRAAPAPPRSAPRRSAGPDANVPALAVNEAAAQLLPESIKSSKVLRVAMPTNEPPTQYYREGTQEMTGINPDVARLIGQALGVKGGNPRGQF